MSSRDFEKFVSLAGDVGGISEVLELAARYVAQEPAEGGHGPTDPFTVEMQAIARLLEHCATRIARAQHSASMEDGARKQGAPR